MKPSLRQADVSDIRAPDLIAPLDFQPAQQIRIHLPVCTWLTEMGFVIDRFQSHQVEQSRHALVIDFLALRFEPGGHSSNAIKGSSRVLLIQ